MLSPPINKTVPPSAPSRHTWAPPQLPFAREIPSLYNETYLRMIPRGPHHIFSFWEIGGEDLEKVNGTAGGVTVEDKAQPFLRLYAVGPGRGKKAGQRMFRIGDIPVPQGIHSRYIGVPESGRTYRMELGMMSSSGGFVPLCQSNEAAVPRARVQSVSKDGARDQQGPGSRVRTQKLIEFSLLSGKMVGEAGLEQPLVFMDEDQTLALEPGSDHSSKSWQGSTVSSWNGWPPASLPGKSAE